MITAEQIKAARALLRLEQEELARRAGVSVSTIRRAEAAYGEGLVAEQTVELVRNVLEEAGVEFIPDGVIRKRPEKRDAEALINRLRAIAERSAALADKTMTEDDLYDEAGLPR